MSEEDRMAYAERCRQSGCCEEYTLYMVACEEERRVSAEAAAHLARIVAEARGRAE